MAFLDCVSLRIYSINAKIYILVPGDSPYRICKVIEALLNDPDTYEFIFFPISGASSYSLKPMVEYIDKLISHIDKKREIIIYDNRFAGKTERFFNYTREMLKFTNVKFIRMGYNTGIIRGIVEAIEGHRCQPRYADATKDIPPIDNTLDKYVIFYLYYYSLKKTAPPPLLRSIDVIHR